MTASLQMAWVSALLWFCLGQGRLPARAPESWYLKAALMLGPSPGHPY